MQFPDAAGLVLKSGVGLGRENSIPAVVIKLLLFGFVFVLICVVGEL
jgi:hypothetical protein